MTKCFRDIDLTQNKQLIRLSIPAHKFFNGTVKISYVAKELVKKESPELEKKKVSHFIWS